MRHRSLPGEAGSWCLDADSRETEEELTRETLIVNDYFADVCFFSFAFAQMHFLSEIAELCLEAADAEQRTSEWDVVSATVSPHPEPLLQSSSDRRTDWIAAEVHHLQANQTCGGQQSQDAIIADAVPVEDEFAQVIQMRRVGKGSCPGITDLIPFEPEYGQLLQTG
jgi:hypothetical protein